MPGGARSPVEDLKKRADEYTITRTNYHSAAWAYGNQHVFLGTGDDLFGSDGRGQSGGRPPQSLYRQSQPDIWHNNQYTASGQFTIVTMCSMPPGGLQMCAIADSLTLSDQSQLRGRSYYMLTTLNPGFMTQRSVRTTQGPRRIPQAVSGTSGDALYEKDLMGLLRGRFTTHAVNGPDGSALSLADWTASNVGLTRRRSGERAQRRSIPRTLGYLAAVSNGPLPAGVLVSPRGLICRRRSPRNAKLRSLRGCDARKILDEIDANSDLKAKKDLLLPSTRGGDYDSGFIRLSILRRRDAHSRWWSLSP